MVFLQGGGVLVPSPFECHGPELAKGLALGVFDCSREYDIMICGPQVLFERALVQESFLRRARTPGRSERTESGPPETPGSLETRT